jgi:hypothetical protein
LIQAWKDLLGIELFLGETGVVFEFIALRALVLIQQLDSLLTIKVGQLRFSQKQIEPTWRQWAPPWAPSSRFCGTRSQCLLWNSGSDEVRVRSMGMDEGIPKADAAMTVFQLGEKRMGCGRGRSHVLDIGMDIGMEPGVRSAYS